MDYLKFQIGITGKVGGVYYSNTSSYKELLQTMNLAMRNGSGGDCPENNIEAVIEGLNQNTNCKAVIMIADNYATPRDLKLLNSITVPIRLVLCGAYDVVNTDYLNMIRRNKGSLHTIEKDIFELSTLTNEQEISINGKRYKVQNNKFIAIK